MSEMPIARSAIGHAAPSGRWRLVIGPLLTLVVGAAIEAAALGGVRIPNSGVLYLAAVAAAITIGGFTAGMMSAALALVLGVVLFSEPGRLFHYRGDDLRDLATVLIATPVILGMVGTLKRRDEVRMRERARLEATEQLRDVLQDLDAVAWERDAATGRVVFVSRGGAALLGEGLDRWLEEPDFWARRIHPDDRERVLERFRDAAARGADGTLEYRLLRPDGGFVWVRDSFRARLDPSGGGRVRGVLLDVSDRRRAEHALRESEERKSAILATALDAIVDIDPEGRITEFNPAAETMFGFPRAAAIGQPMAELIIPPSLRDRHHRGFAHHLGGGAGAMLGRRSETTAMRADGSEFPVEIAVVRTSAGGTPSFTAFLRDIAERRKAEHAIRESERNYRLLMEKASDGIVISDLEGRFVDVNPKVTEMLGYSREELLRLAVADLIPPEELKRHPLRLDELRDGRQVLIERWLRRKDGSPIPVEISAKRLDEGRLQGIYRDISERKRVEGELRQALSLLNATLDSTTDGFLVVDHEGRIVSFNRRFVEMWGIPEDVVASRDDERAIAFVLDQLRDPLGFETKVRELYAMPEAESSDVLEFKDGRVFERTSRPQRIAGVSVGRVWSFRDVTERRRAEEALRQSEDLLRQAHKMEAIGRLAGGVAHDFNNLLTAILGNCTLLLEKLPASDPRHSGAEEIRKAAERASTLTRQLLAFSRKQMLELRVLDLNAVVADMHPMLERLIGEHIELILSPARGLGAVKVDPGQLELVILNLVVNARDAMPNGGTLIVETANVEVDRDFAERHPPLQAGPHVMLAVSDTGIGMDPELQRHLFEPFFTTKERGRGTGLGLSTVYGIVRQCDGAIWVYSAPGRGSTFKIYLPRVPAGAVDPVPAPAPVASPSGAGTETVLLVEDEGVVRTLVRNTLTQRGYPVLEAENGAAALQLSARHRGPIALLVTDVIMPGINGRELAERLSRDRPGIRVLYMSGYTDETIARHGVLEPGAGFLQKPFTLEALARKVRDILDAR